MNVRSALAAGLASIVLIASSGAVRGEGAGPGAPPGDSLYLLDGVFRDQAGSAVRLDVHRGHPVLLSMFYASCRDTCPLLIAELRRVEGGLPAALRADVRVVLVSLDPERDTPPALRGLAERHGLDAARWRLLTGSDDAVREVAAALGVKFRRLSNGMINHSSVIAVLDRRGVVRERFDASAPGDPKRVARMIEGLEGAARAPR